MVAHQAPLSMEFSRQEYWSGLPFPFPEDLSDLGIESVSSALQMDSLPSEPQTEKKMRQVETRVSSLPRGPSLMYSVAERPPPGRHRI